MSPRDLKSWIVDWETDDWLGSLDRSDHRTQERCCSTKIYRYRCELSAQPVVHCAMLTCLPVATDRTERITF